MSEPTSDRAKLEGFRVLLGITGSIAAYKAAEICSRLGKLGADVHVVLTESGSKFVGDATFRALTRNPVLMDTFAEPDDRRIAHIEIAQNADLVLIAPASANTIAKLAAGIADSMLTTCMLAVPTTIPVLVAPAMNTVMWDHPATQANLATLAARGVELIQPGYGLLACQDVGVGKLADVDAIVGAVVARLAPDGDFTGVRTLITAGATREPVDPVRYISNRSSGKMGFAIAAEAASRGAEVTLVTGHTSETPPPGVRLVRVETAAEMHTACLKAFAEADLFIGAAAVADYTPAEYAEHKIKKQESETQLVLKRTEDIAAGLGAIKTLRQVTVGFAAETENLMANAAAKLTKKNLDLIVLNDVTAPGAGFNTDTNIVTILYKDGSHVELPLLTKRETARRLLDAVRSLLPTR